MSGTTVSDARINGDGTVVAGSYGTVTINGSGTVTGDIECRELRINGSGRCNASVRADVATVNGSATFEGPAQIGEFTVNGEATLRAGLGVARLKTAGALRVEGGIAARDIELRGDLRSGKDIDAESFTGEGRFIVAGMLNAGRIDIKVHGKSSAREIGGESIVVREPGGLSSLFSMFIDRRLEVDLIEADDIDLVNTTARVVRGSRVRLGDGCQVDLVEYTERLDLVGGARVTEERRSAKTEGPQQAQVANEQEAESVS